MYNVLRSGANPAMLEGSRGTNEVSPEVRLLISKYYPSSLEGRGGDHRSTERGDLFRIKLAINPRARALCPQSWGR